MNKTLAKFVYWTPRVASILFVIFLALFSLDVFSESKGLWETLGALFIHNIPALLMLAFAIIAWKYEIVGGVAFILAGIIYIFFVFQNPFEWYHLTWILQIAGPAFLIGALYLWGWFKKDETQKARK